MCRVTRTACKQVNWRSLMPKQTSTWPTEPLKKERRLRVGSLEVGVALDARSAERVRNSIPYRYVVRPALNRLSGARNGHNGNGHAATVDDPTVYKAGRIIDKPLAQLTDAATPEARAIIEKISGYQWYHTIDLGHGVSTPGYVDHRAQLPFYHLPEDMTGMRVLDVATFDGFWAFEFERRGAEVVAIDVASMRDIDIPTNWLDEFDNSGVDHEMGVGFRIAKEIRGSKVQREICSVYDASPERLGTFDMVFCSDLLIHLRDPLRAMEAIWTVTKGFAVFADVYHPDLDAFKGNALAQFARAGSGRSDVWWRPNITCYQVWAQLARFSRMEEKSRFVLQANFQDPIPKVVFHAYR
jgi:tRNA (mo5U34)-methyltransferase